MSSAGLTMPPAAAGGRMHDTLADLARLPLDDRCARLIREHRDALDAVTTNSLCMPVRGDPQAFDRLAYAIAHNIGEPPPATTGTYVQHLPADATCAALLEKLAAPGPGGGSPLLAELALSVGCEQRNDWQPPACRPIDRRRAEGYFGFVYAASAAMVQAYLQRAFGDRAGDAESLANEAWARVFSDYWSTHAARRFLGLSRISTLVCQVGRYVALDAIRERHRPAALQSLDNLRDADGNALSPADRFGVELDPSANLSNAELQDAVTRAIAALPARTAVIAEMVWLCGVPATRVAQALKISDPAVSQHISKARDSLRKQLADKCFGPARRRFEKSA